MDQINEYLEILADDSLSEGEKWDKVKGFLKKHKGKIAAGVATAAAGAAGIAAHKKYKKGDFKRRMAKAQPDSYTDHGPSAKSTTDKIKSGLNKVVSKVDSGLQKHQAKVKQAEKDAAPRIAKNAAKFKQFKTSAKKGVKDTASKVVKKVDSALQGHQKRVKQKEKDNQERIAANAEKVNKFKSNVKNKISSIFSSKKEEPAGEKLTPKERVARYRKRKSERLKNAVASH